MPARLLMIEDDPGFIEAMTYLLEKSGYTLRVVRNGREGLEQARQEPPDLILTDLLLPGLNGYEVCTMLKQDARYQKIPIIVWSASKIQEPDQKLAFDCGADAFILKSSEPKQLLGKIQEVLAATPP